MRTALADWQTFFEPLIAEAGDVEVSVLTEGTLRGQVLDSATATVDALARLGLTARSSEVASPLGGAFRDALSALSPAVTAAVGPSSLVDLRRARAATQMWAATGTTETQLSDTRGGHLESATHHVDNVRLRVVVILSIAAVATLMAAVVFGSRARRMQRTAQVDTDRQRFESSLREGLEMARTEAAVYCVTQRALHDVATDLQVELLIADSSRSSFARSSTPAPATQRNRAVVVWAHLSSARP